MVASIALELGGKGRYAEARAPLYVVITSPATAPAVPPPKQKDELWAAGRRLRRGALLTVEMMDKIQRAT
jgi:hypothetical protein